MILGLMERIVLGDRSWRGVGRHGEFSHGVLFRDRLIILYSVHRCIARGFDRVQVQFRDRLEFWKLLQVR